MHVDYKIGLLIAAGWLALGSEVSAQMFGSRTLGTPIAQQGAPSAVPLAATSDTALKGARFLRQNRSQQDFVGVDAQGNAQHFVGTLRGGQSTIVQSAVTDARSRMAAAASNRQLQAAAATPNTRTAMNPPRLEVSFAYSAPPAVKLPSVLSQRLVECPQFHATSPIAVSLAGRTAIVRGAVASAQDRFLAQQLLLFEPGISAVQNELQIQSAPSNRPTPQTRSPAPELPAP
jgi:osmotically-inducible protein OsmY